MKLVKKIGTLSLISYAMLTSQFAQADNEWGDPEWANSAWYIGGGIGQSRANIDEDRIIRSLIDTGASSVTFSSDQRDTAYKLFVGKQLNKNFALEAGYFDLGKYNFQAATTPPGSLNGEVGFRGLNLDMLAQLPLSERFSIYARLGMNYARTDSHFTGDRLFAVSNPNSSDNKLNPKVGLGMEYKFTEALAIRGEAERYRLNDVIHNHTDVDFYSINLVYKLGKPAAKMPVKYVAPPAPAVQEPAPAPKPVPPPKPVPVSEKVTFSAKTLFDFDKSAVKPEGKRALDDLLKSLQGMNAEVMITVGHTDSIGSEEYNQKLSVRRADAVKAYLVSTGVDASRIYTEGKGEIQAAADNKTTEGRAMNRRVTVEVVGSRP
jgi:OOP family OmpA-OmpF porin